MIPFPEIKKKGKRPTRRCETSKRPARREGMNMRTQRKTYLRESMSRPY